MKMLRGTAVLAGAIGSRHVELLEFLYSIVQLVLRDKSSSVRSLQLKYSSLSIFLLWIQPCTPFHLKMKIKYN
ncbi:hypothetical protein Sjap_018959 [Stephania japonica]|uniref:Uncharacterized protein n=1 Tax=Stephania japonica TaxID=461633 RepID=A0AAP0F0M5_9MAGN